MLFMNQDLFWLTEIKQIWSWILAVLAVIFSAYLKFYDKFR